MRSRGIEPRTFAWEANIIPLNYDRILNGCGPWYFKTLSFNNSFYSLVL